MEHTKHNVVETAITALLVERNKIDKALEALQGYSRRTYTRRTVKAVSSDSKPTASKQTTSPRQEPAKRTMSEANRKALSRRMKKRYRLYGGLAKPKGKAAQKAR